MDGYMHACACGLTGFLVDGAWICACIYIYIYIYIDILSWYIHICVYIQICVFI